MGLAAEVVEIDLDRPVPKLNQLYAALPYRVASLEVRLEAPEVARGGTLRFTARLQPPAAQRVRHVVSMRLINPEGEDLRWYRTCFETKEGLARGRIDLALNDPPGRWTLRLKDAASGLTREIGFTVK